MSKLRDDIYRNMPFTLEISEDDFYRYASIGELITNCEVDREKVIKIRTIGVLESMNGRFLIKDINAVNKTEALKIQVSMSYLKSSLQSTILPYTVQIFGTMQWKARPVIYAKIVQVLTTTTALRLNNAVRSISGRHLAKQI